MTSFALKVSLDNELRRVPVDVTQLEFQPLVAQIRQLFTMAPSQTFVLRYTDEDGDLITIDSTPELHEAIALAQSSDKNALKLRITLNEKQSSSTSDNNTTSSTNTQEESSKQDTNQDSTFTNPLLGLASAFAPQIAAVLEQLKQEPQFVQAATNFGLDLSETDPVKLAEQVLANPLLTDLFSGFKPAQGGRCNPFAAMFEASNHSSSSSSSNNSGSNTTDNNDGNPFAALFESGSAGNPFAAMFGGSNHPLAAMFAHCHPAAAARDDNDLAVHRAICDHCQCQIVGVRWKCVSSGCPDYDLCAKCEPMRATVHSPAHIFAKIEKPLTANRGGCCAKQQPSQCQKEQVNNNNNNEQEPPTSDCSVQVLGHESVGLGSVLAAQQPFVKIWRVKNNGTSAWPAGCRAQFVGGQRVGDLRVLVGDGSALAPGSETRVALDCCAPESAGNVKGVWRLFDRSGAELKGDDLVVDIVVVE